jgi:hypothetical protein
MKFGVFYGLNIRNRLALEAFFTLRPYYGKGIAGFTAGEYKRRPKFFIPHAAVQ